MVYVTGKELVSGGITTLLSYHELVCLTVGDMVNSVVNKETEKNFQQEKDMSYLKSNTKFFISLDNVALYANINGATFILDKGIWELKQEKQQTLRDILLKDCIEMEKDYDGKQRQIKLNMSSPYVSGNWYDIVCQIGNKCLVAVDNGFSMFEKTNIRKISDYVDYKYSNVMDDFYELLYNDLSQKMHETESQTLPEYIERCKVNQPIELLPVKG